jgi:hypothetical protein
MLGWHISVFRQTNDGSAPATVDSEEGSRLAVWQADGYGLGWLRELVNAGNAIDLGGNGYPNRYAAMAKHLVPLFLESPPRANKVWTHDPGDIIGEGWLGRTVVDRVTAASCRPEEWLLVVAWDES